MSRKYYLDTCIWIDFCSKRVGFDGNQIGIHARELFIKIIQSKDKIVVSDLVVDELADTKSGVNNIIHILDMLGIITHVNSKNIEIITAKKIGNRRGVPKKDVLHALIAARVNAQLITRDRHFWKLTDIIEPKKPEELV